MKTSTAALFATLAAIVAFNLAVWLTAIGHIAGNSTILLTGFAMVALAACAVLSKRFGD